MRWHSPSYSPPPRRGYGGQGRSPPRVRYREEAPRGLLVRNIPKSTKPEDLRIPFERFGRIRDVYLPKDYYTGEPRGFGFVQFLDPLDAADARRYMDRQIFNGRELTVVFAEENRKRPEEMRTKERSRGRMSYGGRRRSPYRDDSPSRSPRYRSLSPRSARYGRSRSWSPVAYRRHSRSPRRESRSRSRSWRDSMSPQSRSPSPAPKRRMSSSSRRPRDYMEHSQKAYSSQTPEERSPNRGDSPGRSS